MRIQRSALAPSRLISWVPGKKEEVMMWRSQKAFSSGKKRMRKPAMKLSDWVYPILELCRENAYSTRRRDWMMGVSGEEELCLRLLLPLLEAPSSEESGL